MSKYIQLALGVAGLIALAHSSPVEVVYTGEGCDCPRLLDYQLNVPYLPKPKTYRPQEYGYKIDVPVPVSPKSKLSYTFDFIVEKPLKPRPPKDPEYTLYAKVDRVALNKGDCDEVSNYAPEPPALQPPRSCGCRKYPISKPKYRYVYEDVNPWQCQRPQCKCNEQSELSMNSIPTMKHIRISAIKPNRKSSRSKRDLRAFFQQHRLDKEERPGRFIKLYHKSLPGKRQAPSFFQMLAEPQPVQRVVKPVRANKYKRFKRDIMGEYDFLEREREQMDLTLPEIVQFMPETLQPDFKRGRCHFGCAGRQQEMPESITTTDTSKANLEQTDNNSENRSEDAITENSNVEDVSYPPLVYYREPVSPNNIESRTTFDTTSTYTKRNAAQYYQGNSKQASKSLTPIPAPQLPTYIDQNAYQAQLPSLSYSQPNPHTYISPAQQNAYSAPASAVSSSQQPQYGYDNMGQKYVEQNGRLWLINTSATVPDIYSADGIPLQYAGDLNAPPSGKPSSNPSQQHLVGGPRYPVRTISNAALDKVISDIVYRHPDFIDASSHYGGALVDPEPLQQQETKDFLKKLIAGRLRLWFGEEEQHYNPYQSNGYDSSYSPNKRSMPVSGYFPTPNQS